MWNRFSIVVCLLGMTACKTDSSSPTPSTDESTPAKPAARTAPKTPPPTLLPDDPAATGSDRHGDPAAREEWRKRREEKQKEREAKMDTNGDGVVSDEERAAALHQRAEGMRARLDTNGDGKLTVDELKANGQGRMRFDDPAALDTNHDGDISVDELQAAMKDRQGRMRGNRDGSAASPDGN